MRLGVGGSWSTVERTRMGEFAVGGLGLLALQSQRAGQQSVATGGDLLHLMPFDLDESVLTPLAYEYRTGF